MYQQAPPDRTTCGIVALVLGLTMFGWLGLHKFMMGKTRQGIICVLVSVCTCGIAAPIFSIISIVEGIIYLTKTDQQWHQEFAYGGKDWF
jgi:TM2 domain-containing membrane protein YozV